jgi:hypothetical protein
MDFKNLLLQTLSIFKKYDLIDDVLGTKFNIFEILNVQFLEVQTHSRFIVELLNPKGRHNKGQIFLDIFLKRLKIYDVDAKNCEVLREFHIPKIHQDSSGRIDILIRDIINNKNIIIENKIYASEQYDQLVRYRNFDKNSHILYLTLNGDSSKQGEESGYRCISYHQDIIGWLEECRKESTNIPIIRETILQYENLIKHLTGQNTNKAMEKEIIENVLSSKETLNAFFSLTQMQEAIYVKLLKIYGEQLNKISDELKLSISYNIDRSIKYSGFTLRNEYLDSLNLNIFFEFERKYTQELYFGFRYNNPELKCSEASIYKKFKDTFNEASSHNNYLCLATWHSQRYWNNETYKKILTNELVSETKNILERMLICLPIQF